MLFLLSQNIPISFPQVALAAGGDLHDEGGGDVCVMQRKLAEGSECDGGSDHGCGTPVWNECDSIGTADRESWIEDLHKEQGHTPLAQAITLWHAPMMANRELGMKFLDGIRQAAIRFGGVCKVGSMFSGCDIIRHVLLLLSAFWRHTYSIELDFAFVFKAEKHRKKQQFLIGHGSTDVLLSSCDDVVKTMAENKVTGEHILIPQCDWLGAGWPCVNKSRANNTRAGYKR